MEKRTTHTQLICTYIDHSETHSVPTETFSEYNAYTESYRIKVSHELTPRPTPALTITLT